MVQITLWAHWWLNLNENKMLLQVVITLLCISHIDGLNNGLALTPPMGWLSWERFRCQTDCITFPDSCINEKLFMVMADRIVADGYKDVGYEYVTMDDCWLAKERDPKTGKLMPDPSRFPSGIKALADYMHSKGLKLGIYEDFGTRTCAGFPGSEFYMELDANTFAEWEVDFVKFDGCNSDPADMDYGVPAMEFYLNRSGRNMVFSCEWPVDQYIRHMTTNYSAVRNTCNLWRNFDDVDDSWESISSIIDFYGKNVQNFSSFTGPGGWADPDELVVGDYGLSYYQQKAQIGMWAMWSAPLIMSVDLRTIKPQAKALLQNKNIIAIDQDPLGSPAVKIFEFPGSVSVWLKKLSGKPGTYAIAFYNSQAGGVPVRLGTTLGQLGLVNPNGYNVTEVFDNQPLGLHKSTADLVVNVDPTSVYIIKVVPV